jgi:hypothetical protein
MVAAKILVGVAGGLTVAGLAVVGFGSWTWTRAVARLDRRVSTESGHSAPIGAHPLPPPVARYVAQAIPRDAPRVRTARLRQSGTFLLGTGPDAWRAFSAREVFRVDPPAFYWDARIRMVPLVSVRVLDSYIDGRGSMVGKVAGVISVVDDAGGDALARGALGRYLAEAPWFPTRLALGGGLTWEPVDETSARATLEDGDVRATLTFSFDDRGDIIGVSGVRPREVDGRYVDTPWVGRFAEHDEAHGFRIPRYGEVAWVIDGVETTYWRGRVTDVVFEGPDS